MRQLKAANSRQAKIGEAPAAGPVRFTDHLLNRSMPESNEAEAAVIGSMIIDPACIGQVVLQLKDASVFYNYQHQILFTALVSLYTNSTAIDLVLLRDELKKSKQLDEAGGVEYLKKLAESVPSSANVQYYAAIVKDKSLLRELIQVSSEIVNDAYAEDGEPDEKLDQAEQKIFSVTQKKITGDAVSVKELLMQAMQNIETRGKTHITGVPTGYFELDEMTCGLQKGEMVIIAGRPSMGKTSFAMNIAEHIGADNNTPLLIFSIEMSKAQLAERILCSRGHIDSQLVRKGMLSTQQWSELVQTCGELSDKPIFIDDSAGLTPLEIRAKARRLKSMHDIQCIVIDYLQLMSVGGRVESRQQEISVISRYLKGLARELEIPVIVLSQLNRSPEGREDHRPRMSDLRESGSIEQDADVVMLLHREDYYHRGEPDYTNTNKSEVIVAKQRNGPTGTVELVFNDKFTRFENISYAPEPN
jgi:replicative DNA helicase